MPKIEVGAFLLASVSFFIQVLTVLVSSFPEIQISFYYIWMFWLQIGWESHSNFEKLNKSFDKI